MYFRLSIHMGWLFKLWTKKLVLLIFALFFRTPSPSFHGKSVFYYRCIHTCKLWRINSWESLLIQHSELVRSPLLLMTVAFVIINKVYITAFNLILDLCEDFDVGLNPKTSSFPITVFDLQYFAESSSSFMVLPLDAGLWPPGVFIVILLGGAIAFYSWSTVSAWEFWQAYVLHGFS